MSEPVCSASKGGYFCCFICGGSLKHDARVLPCLHIFCQACLESYWRLGPAENPAKSSVDSGEQVVPNDNRSAASSPSERSRQLLPSHVCPDSSLSVQACHIPSATAGDSSLPPKHGSSEVSSSGDPNSLYWQADENHDSYDVCQPLQPQGQAAGNHAQLVSTSDGYVSTDTTRTSGICHNTDAVGIRLNEATSPEAGASSEVTREVKPEVGTQSESDARSEGLQTEAGAQADTAGARTDTRPEASAQPDVRSEPEADGRPEDTKPEAGAQLTKQKRSIKKIFTKTVKDQFIKEKKLTSQKCSTSSASDVSSPTRHGALPDPFQRLECFHVNASLTDQTQQSEPNYISMDRTMSDGFDCEDSEATVISRAKSQPASIDVANGDTSGRRLRTSSLSRNNKIDQRSKPWTANVDDVTNRPLPQPPTQYYAPRRRSANYHLYEDPQVLRSKREAMSLDDYLLPTDAAESDESAEQDGYESYSDDEQQRAVYEVPRDLELQWLRQHAVSGDKRETVFVDPLEYDCPRCGATFPLPTPHDVSSLPLCSFLPDTTLPAHALCPQHPQLPATKFCTSCVTWLCDQCPLSQHRGHTAFIRSLSQLAQRTRGFLASYSKKTRSVIARCSAHNKALRDELTSLHSEREQQLSALTAAYDAIHQMLNQAYTRLRHDMEKCFAGEEQKIEQLLQRNNVMVASMSENAGMIGELSGRDVWRSEELARHVTHNLRFLTEQAAPARLQSRITCHFTRGQQLTSAREFEDMLGSLRRRLVQSAGTAPQHLQTDRAVLHSSYKVTKVSEYSIRLEADGKGSAPSALAVHPRTGDVIIVDDINRKLKVFDADGRFTCSIALDEQVIGEQCCVTFIRTQVVAISSLQRGVLTVDYSGDVSEMKLGGVGRAVGLHYCTLRGLYVVDADSCSVKLFTSSGALKCEFSAPPGYVHSPQFVSVDIDGDVILSDFEGGCLHLFNCRGHYLTRVTPSPFSDPCMLASVVYRQDGSILAVDVQHACVVHLDAAGDYLGVLLNSQHNLRSPQAIVFDRHGRLNILDSGNLLIFDIDEPKITRTRKKRTLTTSQTQKHA